MRQLVIELPGLLDAPYRPDIPHPISGIETPVLDAWRKLATKEPVRPEWCLTQFGIGKSADAYFGALAHGLPDTETRAWLRADLIECRPDGLAVYILGNRHLGLTENELAEFASDINGLLEPEGIVWYPISAWSGYLSLPEPVALELTPLPDALLFDHATVFPSGADAPTWQRRLTELQMLLFEHPVNRKRAQRGSGVLNAMYLWAHKKDRLRVQLSADLIVSDSAMIRGLAIQDAGCQIAREDAVFDIFEHAYDYDDVHIALTHLFWLRRQGLIAQWQQYVLDLERRFFPEIQKEMQKRTLEELILCPGDGFAYRLNPARVSWLGRIMGRFRRWLQK